MKKEDFKALIDSASGKIPCDFLLKNGKILDVFSGEILQETLAVKNGYFVGYGDSYEGEEVDLKGSYVIPGLIDAHIHIESTLATPREFSKAATRHGITTVIMDPHEIGNVLGIRGLQFMLDASRDLPVDFQMMLPSCVPATKNETSGAILSAKELKPFYGQDRIRGLAEVMDLQAVKDTEADMMEKLMDARLSALTIDGHGSGLSAMDNNIYRVAGISTDHECTTLEEARDRLQKGFYIHIREGSVAKNFDALIQLVNKNNSRRFTFCTDDIYISDLYKLGSIDEMIRRAISHEIDPVDAIRMATLNTAECYGLKTKGAVAPGYEADFVILDSLLDFTIRSVYQGGNLIWDQEQLQFDFTDSQLPELENTVILPEITLESLVITAEKGKLNVMEILPNSLLTNHLVIDVQKDLHFLGDPTRDLAKIFVIERHGNHGNIGKGIVQGFRMKKGAVATTIAHDSHNLVAMGMNDEDILLAVNRVKELGGGIVMVHEGRILSELMLDIAGLMSSSSIEKISEDLNRLNDSSREIFHDIEFNPFLTLSFLTLPVIPELKITDKGLYSTTRQRFVGHDETDQEK